MVVTKPLRFLPFSVFLQLKQSGGPLSEKILSIASRPKNANAVGGANINKLARRMAPHFMYRLFRSNIRTRLATLSAAEKVHVLARPITRECRNPGQVRRHACGVIGLVICTLNFALASDNRLFVRTKTPRGQVQIKRPGSVDTEPGLLPVQKIIAANTYRRLCCGLYRPGC